MLALVAVLGPVVVSGMSHTAEVTAGEFLTSLDSCWPPAECAGVGSDTESETRSQGLCR
jgi:hypothetical protein